MKVPAGKVLSRRSQCQREKSVHACSLRTDMLGVGVRMGETTAGGGGGGKAIWADDGRRQEANANIILINRLHKMVIGCHSLLLSTMSYRADEGQSMRTAKRP